MQLVDPVKSEVGLSIGFELAMQCEKLQKTQNKAIVKMPADKNVLFISFILYLSFIAVLPDNLNFFNFKRLT